MDRDPKLNFRKEVLKALKKGIIIKVEAKECLKRGLEEIPIFIWPDSKNRPYLLALEKMAYLYTMAKPLAP